MSQADENGPDKKEDLFFFDVDEIKFPETKLLRPEFHGNISLGHHLRRGLTNQKKIVKDLKPNRNNTLGGSTDIKGPVVVTELEIEDGFNVYEIERCALDWKIFNDKCVFRIGKFYYPFGIERLVENAVNNKLIDRPNPSIKIIPGTYSDEGLELYGNIPFLYKTRLQYELAATNGLSSFEGKGSSTLMITMIMFHWEGVWP